MYLVFSFLIDDVNIGNMFIAIESSPSCIVVSRSYDNSVGIPLSLEPNNYEIIDHNKNNFATYKLKYSHYINMSNTEILRMALYYHIMYYNDTTT